MAKMEKLVVETVCLWCGGREVDPGFHLHLRQVSCRALDEQGREFVCRCCMDPDFWARWNGKCGKQHPCFP